jgi:hypothetical protein
MSKPFVPKLILNVKPTEFNNVSFRSHQVEENGMYANLLKFPNIPEDKTEYSNDLVKFDGYILSAEGNTKNKEKRDEYSYIMYDKLNNNLKYAKLVCGTNLEMMQLTGYEHTLPPEPAQLPETRETKKVVQLKEAGSIRFILEPATGSKKSRRQQKTYFIKIFASETAKEYTIGCTTTNSRELIVKNVPEGVSHFYHIVIQNTAGINELAGKTRYNLVYN